MSYTNFLYHIVFGTKGRLPLITNEIKPRLYEYLGGTVRGMDGIAFEINGIEDHVHLLANVPPKLKFSDFLRDLKANSSRWVNDHFNRNFAWQRRYGAFTVSQSQFDVVRNYIRRQEEHHRKFDFKQEFESLLIANNIQIDEYLWKE
ncbi:MAG: IS200/IS605 family transposase [Acidobacteria bacterium]|nr:IS200/IS605 family transposase [Acidobacteriota bacterium]